VTDIELCACGALLAEVTFAHALSCGDDAPVTEEWAAVLGENVARRMAGERPLLDYPEGGVRP